MLKNIGIKLVFIAAALIPIQLFADTPADGSNKKFSPIIGQQIFSNAKNNVNWKAAFATGKEAQVVFMSVNPTTNPNNEIGMETHKFDQVIFVVEGQAKSILDGKESIVKTGDMIFIPQGTPHNFVNLNGNKPFKIISVYSGTDIPAGAVYKTKLDDSKD